MILYFGTYVVGIRPVRVHSQPLIYFAERAVFATAASEKQPERLASCCL